MRKIQLRKSTTSKLPDFLVRDLNDSQREAAAAPDGANLILAGPGSGKTRVITYRVAYLIAAGVPAESILLVTFTRRAAREMVTRLEALIGLNAKQVWAGTFHHIGNRILRQSAELLGYSPNFTILDSADQSDLIQLAMSDSGLFGSGKMSPKPAAMTFPRNCLEAGPAIDAPGAKARVDDFAAGMVGKPSMRAQVQDKSMESLLKRVPFRPLAPPPLVRPVGIKPTLLRGLRQAGHLTMILPCMNG